MYRPSSSNLFLQLNKEIPELQKKVAALAGKEGFEALITSASELPIALKVAEDEFDLFGDQLVDNTVRLESTIQEIERLFNLQGRFDMKGIHSCNG